MLRHFKKAAVGLAAASLLPSASAFSLIGPYPSWEQAGIGYNLAGDMGGVMNLGEEYRRQTPVITYAFDESFMNYFGQRGVEEIEKAIAVLNGLPPFSSMTDEYMRSLPLRTMDENYRAAALNLLDLKTEALSCLLENVGLTCPERYAWTLRSRTEINSIPYYVTLKRNFDPITFEPSSFVNGVMFSYRIYQTYTTPTYEAVEFTVDPDVEAGASVASLATLEGGTVDWLGVLAPQLGSGIFFKGLTRDDIGGLRYLYRTQNVNVENLPANTVQAPLGALGNYIYDPRLPGAGSPGEGGGSPWGQPGTGTTTGTNTATTNVTSNPFPLVSQALRPGIDKFTFLRVNYDSMVGQWNTLVNRYEDRVVTNGVMSKQTLDRTLAQPDIIFAAGDLGLDADGMPWLINRTLGLTSNDGINGSYALDGPGVYAGGTTITFSKVGPWMWNVGEGGSEATGQRMWVWGAFDDTPAEPIVFPSWVSIADLESRVFSNQIEANPWSSPFMQTVIQNNTQDTTDTTGTTTDTTTTTTDTGG